LLGDTKVLASVSGPVEVRLAVEHASRATFEVMVRPLSGLSGTEAKSLSSTIRSILTPSLLLSKNPRTLIQLVIQSVTPTVSQRFPSTLVASLINASTLALLNTGSVSMRGVVCAVAIGRVRLPNRVAVNTKHKMDLILDPSDGELSSTEGGGCFAFMFAAASNPQDRYMDSERKLSAEVVWSNWHAPDSFDEEELVRARELAKMGAEQVWCKMKDSVTWMGTPEATEL
jgi:exosome complex component RRP46